LQLPALSFGSHAAADLAIVARFLSHLHVSNSEFVCLFFGELSSLMKQQL
jgi:hypothetical protein